MEAMYWITRLDAIYCTIEALLFFGIIGTIFYVAVKIAYKVKSLDKDEFCVYRRYFVPFVVILPISILGLIFVPNTNDALIIYGVGGTLEWIKENNNAKQIPDKAVEALNLYLDNIMEQQSKPTQDTFSN